MIKAISFRIGVPVQIGALYKLPKAACNTLKNNKLGTSQKEGTNYPEYPIHEVDLVAYLLEEQQVKQITNHSTRSEVIQAIIKK
jgi:hypothetical protein